MMILISLGISVSFFYSVYALLLNTFGQPSKMVMDFSFELAILILIMLLGRWLEMQAVMKAGVAALLPLFFYVYWLHNIIITFVAFYHLFDRVKYAAWGDSDRGDLK